MRASPPGPAGPLALAFGTGPSRFLARGKTEFLEHEEDGRLELDPRQIEGAQKEPGLPEGVLIGLGGIDDEPHLELEIGLEEVAEEDRQLSLPERRLVHLVELVELGEEAGLIGRLAPKELGRLGENVAEEPIIREREDDGFGDARSEDLHEFLGEPRGAGLGEEDGVPPDRPPRHEGNAETRRGGVFDRPDHTDRILFENGGEGYDGLDLPRRDVLEAADIVDEDAFKRIIIKGVEGKIASLGVLVHRPELIAYRAVGDGSEGGYLEDLGSGVDMDKAETAAYHAGIAEDAFYPRRRGIGHDVEVLGALVEEEVPYGPSDYVGFVSVFPKTLDNAKGIGVETALLDAVLRLGIHNGFGHRAAVWGSAVANEQR
jgi:hypothetical protein